jgi:hypothetical protein
MLAFGMSRGKADPMATLKQPEMPVRFEPVWLPFKYSIRPLSTQYPARLSHPIECDFENGHRINNLSERAFTIIGIPSSKNKVESVDEEGK